MRSEAEGEASASRGKDASGTLCRGRIRRGCTIGNHPRDSADRLSVEIRHRRGALGWEFGKEFKFSGGEFGVSGWRLAGSEESMMRRAMDEFQDVGVKRGG